MKNEVIKLLKKKSFYIVTLIFVFFCILTNVVYKVLDDFTREEEVDIQEIERENGKSPLVLCVICGLSNAAYKRPDGVYVVPITALKP